MKSTENVARALERLRVTDPLQWLRANLSVPLVEQSALLQTGEPPVELETYYKRWAISENRFDEFARLAMVWTLRTSRWKMLPGIFDPFTQPLAEAIWALLLEKAENHGYAPTDDRDPELEACFAGVSLAPPPEAIEYERVSDRLWTELESAEPGTEQGLKHLRSHPPGFALLYSVIVIDGQVCNGGFGQVHDNECSACLEPAAQAFSLWCRSKMAAIVKEAVDPDADLDGLSEEYYRLRGPIEDRSFELDLWNFPTAHRELFR